MSNKSKQKIDPSEWTSRVRAFLHAEMFTEDEQEACLQFIDFFRDDLPEYVAAKHAIKVYFRMSMFMADEETRKEHAAVLETLVAFANEIADGECDGILSWN